jgi:hypothetical protein
MSRPILCKPPQITANYKSKRVRFNGLRASYKNSLEGCNAFKKKNPNIENSKTLVAV